VNYVLCLWYTVLFGGRRSAICPAAVLDYAVSLSGGLIYGTHFLGLQIHSGGVGSGWRDEDRLCLGDNCFSMLKTLV
jgi:hypothetical protein